MAEYDNNLSKLIKLLKADTKFLESLSKTQVTDLKKVLEENNLAEKDLVEEEVSLTEKIADVAGKTAAGIEAVAGMGQAIRENRDDFKSLQPTVQVAGAVAGELGSKAGKVVSGIGDVISAASWLGGPFIKAAGTVAGVGLSAIGSFMDKNAKQIAQLGVQFSNFALTELQTAFTSFQTLGKVGALGEEGMTSLYNDALTAGIDIANYSKIVSKNAPTMAYFAGTSEKGAKQLAELSAATFDNKQKYLALGMSYEEQFEMQARFLDRRSRLGLERTNDIKQLAAESDDYLDQLNEISRLTGVSRQQADKILEEQLANNRMNASIQEANSRDTTGKIGKNMSNTAAFFQGRGMKSIATGIMDGMAGANSKAAQQLQAITNGESQVILQRLKAGEIDDKTAINQIMAAGKKYGLEMGGGSKEGALEWIASTHGKVSAVDDAANDLLKVMSMPEVTEESLNSAAAAIQQNKNTQDETTEKVVDAQEAMRKMALGFDRMVKDKVIPNATEAVDKLTDVMDDFISSVTGNKSQRQLQKEAAKNGGTPPAGGGTPDTGPPVDPNGALTGKSLSGVNGALANGLTKAAIEYKSMTGKPVVVTSAIRTPEEQQKLYNDYISGKSKYPAAAPGKSKHDRGMAVDIDSGIANQLDSMGLLAKNGLGRPVRGDPVHIEAIQAATGGTFSGPKTGFPAVLHGTEAVVPLPNGRSIPVQMNGSGDASAGQKIQILVEQNAIIDQMISYAKQTHSSGKKLVAYKAN